MQPFTHGFPRTDIHELLSPDLLHQLIKGTFKDHYVTWVNEYLLLVHGETQALGIMQDIDRQYETETVDIKLYLTLDLEFLQFQHTPDCVTFLMGGTFPSGLVMIQRRS